MKKSFLPLVVAAGMVGAMVVPQYSYALTESQRIQQELDQLKKSKSSIQQKAAQTENEISQVQQDKQQTNKDINTILGQIDETNLKLNQLNDQVASVSASLKDNADQLEQAEARITSRDQLLRSRLRLMYMNGVVSYADVLLSSTSFGDFLDRLNALKSIVNQDKEILEANKRDKEVIADKHIQIEKQLNQVKDLYAQAAAVKADLVVKEKEKEVKIASLSKKEKELEDISKDNELQLVQMAKQEAEKQRALQQAKASEAAKQGKSVAQAYTYSGGRFGYPLPKVVQISSDFGVRVDPFTGAKAGHTGIDLPSPMGTDIYAAEAGVVITASWVSGYGNCVIIDHGKGLWTVYGHIRNDGIVVSKGDTVKRGQKIAEVGSTGRSTGNHLHFEVRLNYEPVDPKPYLR
ncbi:peptidoglycan DD-metalloendopeptidase family protein [Paenibacillus filicis]|uniref:Peptidoglycan DD-metalloendopeptidase family protein n=1 Tax=Paenibacillus gyeongsangnamensis TaxID=3388067 RepID=A0ABT4QDG4_9BACL|nr:peptidoglycan DD-metalloendopeptidase family protein [Paenibacillus filicis]MCZ8514913.1 peptidoglycan DD-metalloendopeptidase family protein [Paenibacillus filicis]